MSTDPNEGTKLRWLERFNLASYPAVECTGNFVCPCRSAVASPNSGIWLELGTSLSWALLKSLLRASPPENNWDPNQGPNIAPMNPDSFILTVYLIQTYLECNHTDVMLFVKLMAFFHFCPGLHNFQASWGPACTPELLKKFVTWMGTLPTAQTWAFFGEPDWERWPACTSILCFSNNFDNSFITSGSFFHVGHIFV